MIPIDEGEIFYQGEEITNYNEKQMRPLRKQTQLIFQHPDSILHPRMTIFSSLMEPYMLYKLDTKENAEIQVPLKGLFYFNGDKSKYDVVVHIVELSSIIVKLL